VFLIRKEIFILFHAVIVNMKRKRRFTCICKIFVKETLGFVIFEAHIFLIFTIFDLFLFIKKAPRMGLRMWSGYVVDPKLVNP